MSCNPAIGGIGKSHLMREVDAMGGAMALAADQAAIQIRRLNARKGPAVRATRAQTDRERYRSAIRRRLEGQENLWIVQRSEEHTSELQSRGHIVCRLLLEKKKKNIKQKKEK